MDSTRYSARVTSDVRPLNRITTALLSVLAATLSVASASNQLDGTYELKREGPPSETILPLEYSITIAASKASVTFTRSRREITKDATITKVLRTGIDPETRQPRKDPISEIWIEFSEPGWNSDRLITKVRIPFSLEGDGKTEAIRIGDSATVERTMTNKDKTGISIIVDPMGVRSQAVYKLARSQSN